MGPNSYAIRPEDMNQAYEELDHITKLLIRRDLLLTEANIQLEEKIRDLESARQALACLPRTVLAAFSPIYETAPIGPQPQGKYLNAAAELSTELAPLEMLDKLQEIERQERARAAGRKV